LFFGNLLGTRNINEKKTGRVEKQAIKKNEEECDGSRSRTSIVW
jgi:hypothetical protein